MPQYPPLFRRTRRYGAKAASLGWAFALLENRESQHARRERHDEIQVEIIPRGDDTSWRGDNLRNANLIFESAVQRVTLIATVEPHDGRKSRQISTELRIATIPIYRSHSLALLLTRYPALPVPNTNH